MSNQKTIGDVEPNQDWNGKEPRPSKKQGESDPQVKQHAAVGEKQPQRFDPSRPRPFVTKHWPDVERERFSSQPIRTNLRESTLEIEN